MSQIQYLKSGDVSIASGMGDRRTVTSVTMPSVPSLPTIEPTRSSPSQKPVAEP